MANIMDDVELKELIAELGGSVENVQTALDVNKRIGYKLQTYLDNSVAPLADTPFTKILLDKGYTCKCKLVSDSIKAWLWQNGEDKIIVTLEDGFEEVYQYNPKSPIFS